MGHCKGRPKRSRQRKFTYIGLAETGIAGPRNGIPMKGKSGRGGSTADVVSIGEANLKEAGIHEHDF